MLQKDRFGSVLDAYALVLGIALDTQLFLLPRHVHCLIHQDGALLNGHLVP